MGLQLIRIFFPPSPNELDIHEYEKSVITKIKNDFVIKLNLIEEEPTQDFVFRARETDLNRKNSPFFSWVSLIKDKKDGYFELNAHIPDDRASDYPNYSKISYTEGPLLQVKQISYDENICPIEVIVTCNLNDEKHSAAFRLLELFIRFVYKIQFHASIGQKMNADIEDVSRNYLLQKKPDHKTIEKIPVDNLEKRLDDLNDLFDQVSISVSTLISVKNHLNLDFKNISRIRSRLINDFGISIDLQYLEKKIEEIDYKIIDSQTFLDLLRDKKDITIGKVEIEENRQLLKFNKELLDIHHDASVVEGAALVITFFVIFQIILQVMDTVVANYNEMGIFFKIGIPFFISLGLLSIVELIKEILVTFDRKKKFSLDILFESKIRIYVVLTILSLAVVIGYWYSQIYITSFN